MEQWWDIAETGSDTAAGALPPLRPAPHAAPRGTFAGTILTIMTLLLGYVGVGFARLLF